MSIKLNRERDGLIVGGALEMQLLLLLLFEAVGIFLPSYSSDIAVVK